MLGGAGGFHRGRELGDASTAPYGPVVRVPRLAGLVDLSLGFGNLSATEA